ncbi:hypothetical protein AAG906_026076 [Vitis piasezkii]
MKCTDFLEKAVGVDELVAVGKPFEDDDLMSYIVSGLNPSFNPFITSLSFATRDKNVSFEDFQAELLSYELKPYSRPSFSQNPRPRYSPQPSGLPSSPHQIGRTHFPLLSHLNGLCISVVIHQPVSAMVAHSNVEQEEETWFVDNGANQHIR